MRMIDLQGEEHSKMAHKSELRMKQDKYRHELDNQYKYQ